MTETIDEAERHRAKMAKRKAVQDAEVAEKERRAKAMFESCEAAREGLVIQL